MNSKIKLTMAGILLALIIVSTPVVAQMQNIEVVLNHIRLFLNGVEVQGETILYNNRTYVPVRMISEMLGLEVTFDEATSSAHLNSTATVAPQAQPITPASPTFGTIPVLFDALEIYISAYDFHGVEMSQIEYTNNSSYPVTLLLLEMVDTRTNNSFVVGNISTTLPGDESTSELIPGITASGMSYVRTLTATVHFVKNGETFILNHDIQQGAYTVSRQIALPR